MKGMVHKFICCLKTLYYLFTHHTVVMESLSDILLGRRASATTQMLSCWQPPAPITWGPDDRVTANVAVQISEASTLPLGGPALQVQLSPLIIASVATSTESENRVVSVPAPSLLIHREPASFLRRACRPALLPTMIPPL